MIQAYSLAIAQLRDPQYRRLLWLGMALSFVLLVALSLFAMLVISLLVPGALFLPIVGQVQEVGSGFSFGVLLYLPWLSIFMMAPVASLFSGLYLREVTRAVEEAHYPGQPEPVRIGWRAALRDEIGYFGLLVALNMLALAVFAISRSYGIAALWLVNGVLLSREYYALIARRRVGREEGRALAASRLWRNVPAGIVFAIGLSVPILNLAMPLIGAAVFTHLFNRRAVTDPA